MKTTTRESKMARLADYEESAADFRTMLKNFPNGRGDTVTWWGRKPMPEQEFWAKALRSNEKQIAKLQALLAK